MSLRRITLMTAASVGAKERTAFVLSGGGSLGAIQAGMLMELIAAGVRPDLIVGVSAGAVNGAFLAHDPSVDTTERIAQLWSRVTTREALGLTWRSVFGLLGRQGYVADSSGLRRILERDLPYRSIENAAIPFHILAADEASGSEVILSSGDVIEAVLASAAIPGVFAPVLIDGRRLIDGAVAGTPIAAAARLGATRLLVVPCGFTCVGGAVPRRALGRAMHAINLVGARQLRRDFDEYSARVRVRLVPPLCPLAQSSYDYSHGARLISAARQSTRRWLDEGGLENDEYPHQLLIHVH